MSTIKNRKLLSREKRRRRVRARISGTPERPRLAFFRSNKHVYAQIIDDTVGKTFVGISSRTGTSKGAVAGAESIGSAIAQKAVEHKIVKVVFDRGGFVYTGSVKAFADAARAGGLEF